MSSTTKLRLAPGWLPLFILAAAVLFAMSLSQRRHFDVKNVSIDEAKALVDGGALVIDVREQEKFNARHIPGAILLPLALLRTGIPASIAYAKEKTVVVYCGDGVSHGPEGTDLLNKAGFAHAVNLKTGIEGWAAAGLPVQQ